MNSQVDRNLFSSKEVLGDFYIYAGKSMLILSFQDTLPVRRWNSKFLLLYKNNLSVTNAKVALKMKLDTVKCCKWMRHC